MTPTPDFLTEGETADLLRVTTRTLQRWRSSGDGPAFTRAGQRRVIYARSAVVAWAERRSFPTLAAEAASRIAAAA